MIGMNDLARGGCSEEATLRGIIRVAETIHFRNPSSVVVIQGILPTTSRYDGLLEPQSVGKPLFGKWHSDKHHADVARNAYLLWPSIQSINRELERFCENHDYAVYFDASAMFLAAVYDPEKKEKRYKMNKRRIPDFVHPSLDGWKVLGNAIYKEYNRIVLDEDKTNEIETVENGYN